MISWKVRVAFFLGRMEYITTSAQHKWDFLSKEVSNHHGIWIGPWWLRCFINNFQSREAAAGHLTRTDPYMWSFWGWTQQLAVEARGWGRGGRTDGHGGRGCGRGGRGRGRGRGRTRRSPSAEVSLISSLDWTQTGTFVDCPRISSVYMDSPFRLGLSCLHLYKMRIRYTLYLADEFTVKSITIT